MKPLYSAASVREFDRIAIETLGIAGLTLMERAGTVAFDTLRAYWPAAQRIAVICGSGNNGGDGFILARQARVAGMSVQVAQVEGTQAMKGDALQAAEAFHAAGGEVVGLERLELETVDVIVDALFGTGLSREVSGVWRETIERVNAVGKPVLALDIPSGLNADTGAPLGVAVRATHTLTFIAPKRGLFTGPAGDYCGSVQVAGLALPSQLFDRHPADALLMVAEDLRAWLPPRSDSTHKGECGHALIVGGDRGMGGAVRLAAEAAARGGAGLVSVATQAAQVSAINAARPELMCHGIDSADDLEPLIARADVIAIGPGLGRAAWGQALLASVLQSELPLVIDADALNLLAENQMHRDRWILTPHPGEAARLLGVTAAHIQADRFAAARMIAARYGGVCVLKGAGTLVVTGDDPVAVCAAGNPGMASGGMGDVLSGVIAALLAQGLSMIDAARAGVLAHAHAGDLAATAGERGMLAGDVIGCLRQAMNPSP